MTTDIDAVVRGDRTSPAALLRVLAGKRIVPRIENAEAFAHETFVLLLRHEPTGVELDVSPGPSKEPVKRGDKAATKTAPRKGDGRKVAPSASKPARKRRAR